MTDTIPPQPRLTLSRWLISTLLTAALVFGALGGLAVLFLGDRFFDIGEDPVIPAQEVRRQVNDIDQRIQRVEQQVGEREKTASDFSHLQNDLAKTADDTANLHEKIDQINAAGQNGVETNRLVLGITQLKTAYEYDLPLQPALDTLKTGVKNGEIQQKLAELGNLAAHGLPSKDAILASIDALGAKTTPSPLLNQSDLSLKDRAKLALAQFVRIRKSDEVTREGLLRDLRQAITLNDLTAAASLVARLPETAENALLSTQIKTRLRAQQLTRDAVGSVSQLANPAQGDLY